MTARAIPLLFALLLSAQADTLILRDGTHVTGRWWSIDASQLHFLVDNQLQHYARSEVSVVTFGSTVLPTPATAAVPPPKAPAAAPAPPEPPSEIMLPGPAPLREPAEGGAVYFRNGSGDLMPLERTQATEQKHGSAHYWEMAAARSPVRLKTAPELVFVVRLAKGIDPDSLSLFPLAAANGSRRTKADPSRKTAPLTMPFTATKAGESTYTLTVKDLPIGEYAFSPDGSNDGYCFGVDGRP